ncbi:NfeD family protein [Halanaerocella petrolearia]
MIFKIWFIISIVFFILELLSPTFFLICFGIGALVTSLFGLFSINLTVQILIFIISSLLTLVFLRPFFLKYLDKDSEDKKTNVDALVGQTAIVSEKIIPSENKGRVEIAGDSWLAISKVDKEISQGERVEILEVEGTKVYVIRRETD